MRYSVLVLSAAVAGLPAAGAAQTVPVQLPVEAVLPEGTILDVTATGRSTQTPDLATVRAGVVTQATTAGEAQQQNAARMATVLAALKRAGIAPRDIATSNLSLSPQYKYGEGQPPAITGYQATNSVSVKFRDIAKAGAVLDALVRSGANQIDGPNLSLDKPDAALDAARTDAVARARARAELYAKAAGLRVDRIVSISENGDNSGNPPPPVPRYAMARAEAADTAILPGETDVTATIVVRFHLR